MSGGAQTAFEDAYSQLRAERRAAVRSQVLPTDVHRFGRSASIGDRYGALVVESLARTDERSGTWWSCRCDCGEVCVRTTARLNQSARKGWMIACQKCTRTRFTSAERQRLEMLSRAYRVQYEELGTLWTEPQSELLRDSVLDDLVDAFGPGEESSPSLPLLVAPWWHDGARS